MKKIVMSLAIASSFAFATSVYAGCIKSGGGCVVSESGKPVSSNMSKAGHSGASKPAKNKHSTTSMPGSASQSAASVTKDTVNSVPASKSAAKPASGVKDPCCWAP